ncbi:MAG: RCC1 domain-containing protein, partial [Persicimonas sp.]
SVDWLALQGAKIMCFLKEMRVLFALFAVLLVIVGLSSGCSLVDDASASARTSSGGGGDEDDRQSSVVEVESPTLEPAETVDVEPGPSDGECTASTDCAELDNTERWCSEEGRCEYSCEPGFADANGEATEDGCECEVTSPSADVCDGTDSDCDGVVDNPYAGGVVAAGDAATCGADRAGALRCWGNDLELESDDVKLAQLDVSANHGCGVDEDGDVFCWGDDTYGKLGEGADEPVDHPVEVDTDQRFTQVATGLDHSCGLTEEGTIECWGRNDYGQLGDGTTEHRAEPARVSATIDFVEVTAGEFHTCALSAAGDALCWGANHLGQASESSSSQINVPSPQEAPPAFDTISAGAYHTCALDSGGLAYCWGANDDGQLGDDTVDKRAKPGPIADELGLESVAAGGSHTCGISDGGKLYCWGSDRDGRLALDDDTHDNRSPAPAAGSLRFEQVTTGGAHTCALDGDGHLYCWGEGTRGQLGGGTSSSSRRPGRADCPG